MAAIDDWAAAAYAEIKRGANVLNVIDQMLDINNDHEGIHNRVRELRDELIAFEEVPVA